MTTWADVRSDILTLLDCRRDATTSSDVRLAVDNSMARHRAALINQRKPRTYLKSSNEVNITSTTVFIPLGVDETYKTVLQPGFGVTDLWQPRFFTVRDDEDDEIDARRLEFVPWEVWLQAMDYLGGDQRMQRWVSLSSDSRFWFKVTASSSETYVAKLWYWPTLAAITDGGTPELGDEHLAVLIDAVALEFPNLFEGEARQLLYATINVRYQKALEEYRRDMMGITGMRMRPRGRIKRASLSLDLGDDYESV